MDIMRQVQTADITNHFVDFMKSDNVGLLSNHLLILSDRLDTGTRDKDCIVIAELISNALDFSKNGIKVRDSSQSSVHQAKLFLSTARNGETAQIHQTSQTRFHGPRTSRHHQHT
jgi:hypothetical protein